MKLPSDGLTLLKIPFYNKTKLKTLFNANQLLEAYDHFERKEYEEALRIYSAYHTENPEALLPLLNICIIKLRMGQFEEALRIVGPLEAKLGDKEFIAYRGLVYNCFAWVHLLLGNIDLADQYSALALQAAPRESNFSGTRGSVLIEKGAVDEGINLLLPNMTFDYVNPATLAASIYLMLAYHKKGETGKRDRYLQFARKNADKLEADDRFLFERNLGRMG
jgi:tetratricopeptide (TPR) repeat protein